MTRIPQPSNLKDLLSQLIIQVQAPKGPRSVGPAGWQATPWTKVAAEEEEERSCFAWSTLLFGAALRDLKGSSKGDIDIDVDVDVVDVDAEVDVDTDSCFGSLWGTSKV